MSKGKTSNIATTPLRGNRLRDGNGRDERQATRGRNQHESDFAQKESLSPGRGIPNPVK